MSPRPVALITGPTSGIGRAFALQLAERGYDFVLVARDRDRLEGLAEELHTVYGASAELLVADLVDRAELGTVEARLAADTAPDDTSSLLGPVDLLVNNAGFGLKRRFMNNTVEQEQAHLDILVTAVMRLTHAALAPMIARGRGGIINVSSVAGFQPRGSYSAAKAYVTMLGEWAAHEYRPQGVRVMTLCPGFTKTEFHERMDVGRGAVPPFLWLEVDDLVRTALADFDAGKAMSVPSRRYKAIVSVSRHVPNGVLQRFQSIGRR